MMTQEELPKRYSAKQVMRGYKNRISCSNPSKKIKKKG
jgi:hypothetical protein